MATAKNGNGKNGNGNKAMEKNGDIIVFVKLSKKLMAVNFF